ncbi:hypothetical protein [Pararobbsia alpina]|uniref:Uncharacterized protein n=1 Tax=Pararobbsia alpina TaxID=621374 RepID=A0A6S7BHK5_9BURK|nr:hypothetical protein [Pararobbsia alpina]CAB3800656.1 hypothetical protein LMG28138_04880 [Pararobbsia alpina]
MTTKALMPQWKALNQPAESNQGRLLGALLTTFDSPDAGVLIESYLPGWLGLEGICVDEGGDRLRYFAELEDALRRLKGRIVIISSPGTAHISADGWIWNYIRRYEVGAERQATQHAKLWMFHRAATQADGAETLEIVVSSANLTRDGLRGQIQSAWRCVVPLDATGADARARSWGCLPSFLAALGQSAGMDRQQGIEPWQALLRRCVCPVGVDFVGSVPGSHSADTLGRRETAWGAVGLRMLWTNATGRQLAIVAPTIGQWTRAGFSQWAETAGVSPKRLSLGWIRSEHPWAWRNGWTLDASSEAALSDAGVRWREVPVPTDDEEWQSPFCAEHPKRDLRWSHAKLYLLRAGQSRKMLVTSANLSQAAWGKPSGDHGLKIRNFELGVAFSTADSFSDRLHDNAYTRHTCEVPYEQDEELPIAWLGAEWDGNVLRIVCRTRDELSGQVEIAAARDTRLHRCDVDWNPGESAQATIAWPAASQPAPLAVHVKTTNGAPRTVTVLDTRSGEDGDFLCSEFDESLLSDALDDLLEERYGYQPLGGHGGTVRKGPPPADGPPPAGTYAVPAWLDARRRFLLIDNWFKALVEADEQARPFILDDGKRIQRRWMVAAETISDQSIASAARIAAEELEMRIRKYS